MSNRELVQSLYEAFARGDAGTVLAAFDPEIVWVAAESIPHADGSPYVGPQQVAEGVFARLMTEWSGFTINVEQLLQDDDMVVAIGRYRATHRATGRPLDAQFVHVWTLRGGRITRFRQYADTLQFARVTEGAGEAAAAPDSAAGMPRTGAAEATSVR